MRKIKKRLKTPTHRHTTPRETKVCVTFSDNGNSNSTHTNTHTKTRRNHNAHTPIGKKLPTCASKEHGALTVC